MATPDWLSLTGQSERRHLGMDKCWFLAEQQTWDQSVLRTSKLSVNGRLWQRILAKYGTQAR